LRLIQNPGSLNGDQKYSKESFRAFEPVIETGIFGLRQHPIQNGRPFGWQFSATGTTI
jgi:hypothetical protein